MDKKKSDRDYLKQFEDKSTKDLLDFLCKEAEELKQLIKEVLNKAKK